MWYVEGCTTRAWEYRVGPARFSGSRRNDWPFGDILDWNLIIDIELDVGNVYVCRYLFVYCCMSDCPTAAMPKSPSHQVQDQDAHDLLFFEKLEVFSTSVHGLVT